MRSSLIPLSLVLTISCSMTLGCRSLTLGPTTEREFIIVHAGQPIQVLENTKVTGRRLDGAGPAEVDIGGWICMSPDHWEALKRKLDSAHPALPTPSALTVIPSAPEEKH